MKFKRWEELTLTNIYYITIYASICISKLLIKRIFKVLNAYSSNILNNHFK